MAMFSCYERTLEYVTSVHALYYYCQINRRIRVMEGVGMVGVRSWTSSLI